MNYKFVKITSYYRKFLEHYYSRYPDIINENYERQLKHILDQGFGWADFYKKNMELIGNEAHEIVFNVKHMQKKWAEEYNLKVAGSDILFNQLKRMEPNVIFFQDSLSFAPEFIKKVREEIPSVKLIIGWLCSPFSDLHLEVFRTFDFVCACSPEFSNYLDNKGIKVFELNHAFEKSILNKLDNTDKENELTFIGSFIITNDFHNERIKLFETLIDAGIKINIYTDLDEQPWLRLKSVQMLYLYIKLLEKFGFSSIIKKIPVMKKTASLSEYPRKLNLSDKFRRSVKPPLYGYDMFKVLNRSAIGLNIHGGIAGDYAANSRMFEITGVGSLIITDDKKNMKELFVPDKEVLVYRSLAECKEKIKYVLDNPAELRKIAAAGQKRTLRDHTFLNRTEKLNDIILRHLK